VRLAIEAIRAVMPLLEQVAPQQVGPIRDALSQLQLAYVQIRGGAAAEGGAPGGPGGGPGAPGGPDVPGGSGAQQPGQAPPKPGDPGPAQRSGRLWVPGQR
jgi:hypothetical protein